MRSHAKASSAGTIEGSGNSRGLFRRASAARGASSDVKGSGARSLRLFGLAFLLVGMFTAMLGSGSAQAALKWFNTGEFANGGFSEPTKIAVDNSSGNVLAVDSDKGRVQVFDSGGTAASLLTSFGEGELVNPYGIAVDQSNGDVYVSNSVYERQVIDIANTSGGTYTLSFGGQTTGSISFNTDPSNVQIPLEELSTIGHHNVEVQGDFEHRTISFRGSLAETDVEQLTVDGSGLEAASPETGPAEIGVKTIRQGAPGEIFKFAPNSRANPTSYSKVPSFTSPPRGSDAGAGQIGRFASALAVDPTNGDLLVADSGNLQVSRFSSDGAFLDSFDGADTVAGPFIHLSDLTVDPDGGIYVLADGAIQGDYGQIGVVTGSRVERFTSGGVASGSLGAPGSLDSARSIGIDSVSGNVLVAFGGGVSGTGPATVLSFHAGNLLFSVENLVGPNRDIGLASGDPSRIYALTGFEQTPLGPLGFPSVQIFEQRFVPEVTLDAPSLVAPHGAHLSGTVNPGGEPDTHYHFEYSADGGNSWTPTPEETAGTGSAPEPVEADIAGLEHASDYQVRLVASNKYDSATSEARTFTTLPVLPTIVTGAATDRTATGATLRGVINPNGAQTTYHFEYGLTTAYGFRSPTFEAAAGKERIPLYVSQVIGGLQAGATYHYRLVAQNAAGSEAGLDKTFVVPVSVSGGPNRSYELVSPADKAGGDIEPRYFQASEDGNTIAFLTKVGIGSTKTEAASALIRFIARRGADGWSSKGTDPPQQKSDLGTPAVVFTMAVSRDGNQAVVFTNKKLAPDSFDHGSNVYLRNTLTGTYRTLATEPTENYYFGTLMLGAAPVVYGGSTDFARVFIPARGTSFPPGTVVEYHDGQFQAASVDPGGNTILGEYKGVSTDGSKLFFRSEGVLYVRVNGTTTKMIPGEYVGSSSDGSIAYTFGKELTEDSEAGVRNLYRFTVESGALEKLAPIGPVGGNDTKVLDVSDNGAAVYLSSPYDLTGEGGSGMGIYAWYGGELSRVSMSQEGGSYGIYRAEASPNGRYLAIDTGDTITDYDPASLKCPSTGTSGVFPPCHQVYRYDAVTHDLACLSCRPDGAPPTGAAEIGESEVYAGGTALPHVVTDAGQVFFDTPEQLVSADSNSFQDVYEYDGTEVRLVSSGHGLPSKISEVSVDGSNVYFTTKDRLVGIDTDGATDLYDARVDGGFASQNPPPAREECIRDDCKATPNVGPELPFGGSEGLNGPENVKAGTKKRCGKGRQVRRVKGKSRCIKQDKRKNRTNDNRRQGR